MTLPPKMFVKCNDGIWRIDPPEKLIREPRFFSDDGFLTRYGFACGYFERDTQGLYAVEMIMEQRTYHVKVFLDHKLIEWHVFDDDYEDAKRQFLEYSNQYTTPKGYR